MKSLTPGKNTSASVENITPFGVWMLINRKEYFLPYSEFPYFENMSIRSIFNVEFSHGFHLYWPELDIDLTIDNLDHPEKYPLRAKNCSKKASRAQSVNSISS
jgi:hypothetical protein